MNSIRQVQALNKRELELGVAPEASWHRDYDSAYVYIGGLPFDLSEGDIITIFSQFGDPVHINLVRDKETGKSKGFAFLKYEDQHSTDLAVDNLGGAVVMGRVLRVDHANYKRKEDEVERIDDVKDGMSSGQREDGEGRDGDRRKRRRTDESGSEDASPPPRPLLKEERELAALIREHDDDDPMKAYLVQQKREEVKEAVTKLDATRRNKIKDSKAHRHRHSRRDRSADNSGDESHGKQRSHRADDSKDGGDRKHSRRKGEESGGERERRVERQHRPRGDDGASERVRAKIKSEDDRTESYRDSHRSRSRDPRIKEETSKAERNHNGTQGRRDSRHSRDIQSEDDRLDKRRRYRNDFNSNDELSAEHYRRRHRSRRDR